MQKVKPSPTFPKTIIFALLIVVFFTTLTTSSNSSARQLTTEERKFYAQNNIIFTVPCDTEADCAHATTTTPDTPETPTTPDTPESPDSPTAPDTPVDPSSPTTGALGYTGPTSALYSQFSPTYKNKQWKGGNCPNCTVGGSGCPLVAAANALHTLDVNITLDTLISEMKSHTNNFTNRQGLFNNNNDWSNHGDSIIKWFARKHGATTTTINSSQLDTYLANGYRITMFGKRSASSCSTSDASAGKCIFSHGGHYIAIVGRTANGEYIIGNPANGSGRKYTLSQLTSPLSTYSFIAIKL